MIPGNFTSGLYTTVADVHLYNDSLSSDGDATLLTEFISSASLTFDQLTGQALGQYSYTRERIYSVFSGSTTSLFLFPRCPVITSVTELWWKPSGSSRSNYQQFTFNSANLEIKNDRRGARVEFFTFLSTTPGAGLIDVQLTFTGGYAPIGTTGINEVPMDLQEACKRLVYYNYNKRTQAGNDRQVIPGLDGSITIPGGWPPEIMQVLRQYTWRRPI